MCFSWEIKKIPINYRKIIGIFDQKLSELYSWDKYSGKEAGINF